MLSMTAYSSYETLAFFQSVVRHGSDASALQNISAALKGNEHIRNNTSFDEKRLSANALQSLYHHHVTAKQSKQSHVVNGDSNSGERSPKRRKLSNSEQSQDALLQENEIVLQELVDRLFVNYKKDVIREIKADEEAFVQLQDEIRTLEVQVEQGNKHAKDSSPVPAQRTEGRIVATPAASDRQLIESSQTLSRPGSKLQDADKASIATQSPSAGIVENKVPGSHRQQAISPLPTEIPSSQQLSQTQQPKGTNIAAPVHNQYQSPGGIPRQLPSPSPQRPNVGSVQSQPPFLQSQIPPGHVTATIPGGQLRSQPRTQQAGTQGRASPMPYPGQHAYPQYPPYPHPQWHPHSTPQQYQPHNPYVHPQYYPQPPNGRPPHTPQPMPYPPYHHTVPGPYMQQQPQWRGQPWPVHPAPVMTTPIPRHDGRQSLPGSRSSTPWKKRQQQVQSRPKTPPLPDREVSPLTDREESPIAARRPRDEETKPRTSKQEILPAQQTLLRRGRLASVTPSALGPSRSQSIASRASDTPAEVSRPAQKIKAEPPSTPLPSGIPDNERHSSERRGRPRSSTIHSQTEGVRAVNAKRKRGSISPTSPAHSPQSVFVTPLSKRHNQILHPSLVVVSRNFAKTSQLLINEITSHKLAGIFSKPLSERDAPGYKDLILRTQDLKSIKAAISKGGRASLPAIEAIESERDATMTPRTQNNTLIANEPGSLGNGFYLVPKSADLIPPKGIVNSAQLEMELVRMFANAVMFNPLPSSERGFGRSLRLRKHGGDVNLSTEVEENTAIEDSEIGSSSGMEEDGIIADAREMFNDVVETVGKWRELEDERMGLSTEASVSRHGSLAVPPVSMTENGRHNSVGESSNIGDDDTAAGESEAASTPIPTTTSGPGRKRRKLAER